MTDAALIGPVDPPELHVMTYNIRYRKARASRRSPDQWARRRPLLKKLLQREQPTVLGIQEGTPVQVEFISRSLGAAYLKVGRGRDANGEGEQCAIFYDSRRLTLESWNQRSLSESPFVAGSRTWGNMLPRIVVSAEFTDTATGIRFWVVNTHLDNLSRTSRARSAVMLNDLVDGLGTPTILMGDMNSGVRSVPYRTLTGGRLKDAWYTTHERLTPAWGTYSGYRAPKEGAKRIDWLLVTETVKVVAMGINVARFDGLPPSDHEPVQARLRF